MPLHCLGHYPSLFNNQTQYGKTSLLSYIVYEQAMTSLGIPRAQLHHVGASTLIFRFAHDFLISHQRIDIFPILNTRDYVVEAE
jgi:hypothetical protein